MVATEEMLARCPAVVARLRASVSGFVLTRKFSLRDRGALKALIAKGEVEIVETALGRAYRLRPAASSA